MKDPKVSVLLPVYNTNPAYLKAAVDSILSQTYKDFEFLILNDSPDNKELEKLVKSYKDVRIKYFKNEKNLGISNSRNKLMDLAKGKYMAVFDHDDISMPTRLSSQVEFLDKNPQVGVVGSWYKMIVGGEVIKLATSSQDIKEYLLFGQNISHSATMFRKSVLKDNNIRYKHEFFPSEDYMIYVDLLGKTEFANIPEVLLNYRNHRKNTSHKEVAKMAEIRKKIQQIAKRNNYDLYLSVSDKIQQITRIKFLGLPIFVIKEKNHIGKILLFGLFKIFTFEKKYKVR